MPTDAGRRPLLLHAHPGHELRLCRWIETHNPTLFLMTDGSSAAVARTDYSRRFIAEAGATEGAAFGLAPDKDWYAAILAGDAALFERMVAALVEAGMAQRSTLLVSDAVDGYNPMHDLCEATGAAAVARLRRLGLPARHLVARATAGGEDVTFELRLGSEALLRKHSAIEAYTPLAEEARALLQEEPQALAHERLRLPTFAWPAGLRPAWEKIGSERVAAGKYFRPIEYDRDVRPMALHLLGMHDHIQERVSCAS